MEGFEFGDLIRKVQEGRETLFEVVEGVDGGKRLEVAFRRLPAAQPTIIEEPPIARAGKRSHVFHDVDAFCEYLNRNCDKNRSLVLADVNHKTIEAVLDDESEIDREVIQLRAMEHPAFTPWGELLDSTIEVTQFAMHCMKYRRAIVEPDGRELAMTFSQVKMSKAIQVSTGAGKKSLNGVIVDIEIAGERKGVPVELPDTIVIEVPIFVGTSAQRIEIDLLVTARGEQVAVTATASDVDVQRIEAFESMVAVIREKTGQLVGMGVVRESEWSVLKQQA